MVCITVINTLLSFILAAGVIWNAEGMKGAWRISHNHPLLMTFIDGEHPLRYVYMYLYNINKISWKVE